MARTNRILLIHPLGYSPELATTDVSRITNLMPPLGLASIAAVLDENRIPNDIIDCHCHPADSQARILDYVEKKVPGFVGFSCTTSSFLDGVKTAQRIKAVNPDIRTVFGGPHVSALRESLLESYPAIDYLVVGEGEVTLTELLSPHGKKPEEIQGLVFRDAGRVKFTGFRKQLQDLDSLPFPAYKKLEGYPDAYKLPIFNYPKAPNASCISSRGCPYACSYCDRSVFRRTFRYNSAQYLFSHVTYLNREFGIRHINFYDDQFTFHRGRVVEFCKLMIRDNPGMTFNCAARAEHLDFELLQLMKAAGCWMISLGVETGDPDLLARHRQNPDLDMLRDKIMLIKKAGIRFKALLMMGLPGETEASIKKSKAYVDSLPVDDFNLAKFTPFPGSPIYDEIKANGAALGRFDENWEEMDCMEFLFIPKQMKKERMDELFINFYKSHFMRPRVLAQYLTMVWKSPDSWRRLLADLAGFLKFIGRKKRM